MTDAIPMPKTLIIDPLHNSPGRHDDTGAFEPAAQLIKHALGDSAERWSYDNVKLRHTRDRMNVLVNFLNERSNEKNDALENLIHIGHGLHDECQVGLSVSNVEFFFGHYLKNVKRVIFFSCSTASAPLATSLAWAVASKTAVTDVFAHTKEGHATECPWLLHLRDSGTHMVVKPATRTFAEFKDWLRHGDGYVHLTTAILGHVETAPYHWDEEGFFNWLGNNK